MMDVPLICDPVPGPSGIITTSRRLSAADVERFRKRWALVSKGFASPSEILPAAYRFQPLTAGRTEWPDAEYCAA
jgi:hypothetical protein